MSIVSLGVGALQNVVSAGLTCAPYLVTAGVTTLGFLGLAFRSQAEATAVMANSTDFFRIESVVIEPLGIQNRHVEKLNSLKETKTAEFWERITAFAKAKMEGNRTKALDEYTRLKAIWTQHFSSLFADRPKGPTRSVSFPPPPPSEEDLKRTRHEKAMQTYRNICVPYIALRDQLFNAPEAMHNNQDPLYVETERARLSAQTALKDLAAQAYPELVQYSLPPIEKNVEEQKKRERVLNEYVDACKKFGESQDAVYEDPLAITNEMNPLYKQMNNARAAVEKMEKDHPSWYFCEKNALRARPLSKPDVLERNKVYQELSSNLETATHRYCNYDNSRYVNHEMQKELIAMQTFVEEHQWYREEAKLWTTLTSGVLDGNIFCQPLVYSS